MALTENGRSLASALERIDAIGRSLSQANGSLNASLGALVGFPPEIAASGNATGRPTTDVLVDKLHGLLDALIFEVGATEGHARRLANATRSSDRNTALGQAYSSAGLDAANLQFTGSQGIAMGPGYIG